MNVNDLVVDIGRQVQLKRDLIASLKTHGHDPEESARVAHALIEIGIHAFRAAGMGPFLAMALCQMIAHGATTERALKAIMLIQDEDEAKDQIDPSRKERRAAANAHDDEDEAGEPAPKKQRVM